MVLSQTQLNGSDVEALSMEQNRTLRNIDRPASESKNREYVLSNDIIGTRTEAHIEATKHLVHEHVDGTILHLVRRQPLGVVYAMSGCPLNFLDERPESVRTNQIPAPVSLVSAVIINMLSNIFYDPAVWEDKEDCESEASNSARDEMAGAIDLHTTCNFQDLSESLPCGAIATVSFRKHHLGPGPETWTVHKHRCEAHRPESGETAFKILIGDDGQERVGKSL